MDNNFDNTPDNQNQTDGQPAYTDPNAGAQQTYTDPNAGAQQTYTDPNAGAQQTYTDSNAGAQQYNYQQTGTAADQQYNYNYQQAQQDGSNYQQQYQDNYNYNVGNNTGYNQPYNTGMDTTPMSMGDWVLTILALCIPCAGIVLYFVWAFGKNGNVNRRNYCRASLAITGVVLVLYIILVVIFGAALIGGASYY